MKKAFKAFLFFLLLLLIFANKALANTNFSSDYKINYTISNNANTKVNINVSLKNLSEKYYASSYSITVGFKDLNKLKVTDIQGEIKPTISDTQNGKIITLNFNKNVFGKNNVLKFNIDFETHEVAQNLNNIWEINIPGVANANDYSSFDVVVNYPPNLGKPTYKKPNITKKEDTIGKLSFSKNDLNGSGVSVSFGKFQIYDFNLKYHLVNNNLFFVSTKISLPLDTGYQKVQINDITPKPLNVTRDSDGNWLAEYKVPALKKLDVGVKGKVKIKLTPDKEIISIKQKDEYLKPLKYWEVDDKKIKDIVKDLKTPEQIYNYVVKKLNYNYAKVAFNAPRLGALQVLENPNSAVCLEFTDLFIALSRAAGIPAREVDGFAFSSNTSQRPTSLLNDVLHAWPEYYNFDNNTWVMVDPTWGKTTNGVDYFHTFDFDHIAFVVKGVNSEYPIPAGGYKLDKNENLKDVDIKVSNSFVKTNNFNTEIKTNEPIIAGLPIFTNIVIYNLSNQSIKKSISASSKNLSPFVNSFNTDIIPPFGSYKYLLGFSGSSFLTNSNETIKITIDSKTYSLEIKISSLLRNKTVLLGGAIFVSISIIVSIIAYGLRGLPIFKRKR